VVAHPGVRFDEHEGRDAASDGGRVDFHGGPPDDVLIPELAHAFVGGARREPHRLPQDGVRLRRVTLEFVEQHAIYFIHGLTISGSVIHAFCRIS
jgi:hypothetical protein